MKKTYELTMEELEEVIMDTTNEPTHEGDIVEIEWLYAKEKKELIGVRVIYGDCK